MIHFLSFISSLFDCSYLAVPDLTERTFLSGGGKGAPPLRTRLTGHPFAVAVTNFGRVTGSAKFNPSEGVIGCREIRRIVILRLNRVDILVLLDYV